LGHEVAVLPEQAGEGTDRRESGTLVQRAGSAVGDQPDLLQVSTTPDFDRFLDQVQADAAGPEARIHPHGGEVQDVAARGGPGRTDHHPQDRRAGGDRAHPPGGRAQRRASGEGIRLVRRALARRCRPLVLLHPVLRALRASVRSLARGGFRRRSAAGKDLKISRAMSGASPTSAAARSPARPCRYTPSLAAADTSIPWASRPTTRPVRTSPDPPVAIPGLPVGFTCTLPAGVATRLRYPFRTR